MCPVVIRHQDFSWKLRRLDCAAEHLPSLEVDIQGFAPHARKN
jgi:hypothetical protein